MKGLLAMFLSFGCLTLVALMIAATSQTAIVDSRVVTSTDLGVIAGS